MRRLIITVFPGWWGGYIKGTRNVKWRKFHLYSGEIGEGRPYAMPKDFPTAVVDVDTAFTEAIETIQYNCKEDSGQ